MMQWPPHPICRVHQMNLLGDGCSSSAYLVYTPLFSPMARFGTVQHAWHWPSATDLQPSLPCDVDDTRAFGPETRPGRWGVFTRRLFQDDPNLGAEGTSRIGKEKTRKNKTDLAGR